jgi:DNA-binding transcriptional MerR regulator
MHDIDHLAAILGLTPNQVRVRLNEFKDLLETHLKRGDNNKILVDNDGLAILRRAKELEDLGNTLQAVSNLLKLELASNGRKSQQEAISSASAYRDELVQTLRNQVEELKRDKEILVEQLKEKEREIERLHDLLNRQLPPARAARRWWQFWK